MEPININKIISTEPLVNEDIDLSNTIYNYMNKAYDDIEKSLFLYIILQDILKDPIDIIKYYVYYLQKENIDYSIKDDRITITHAEYIIEVSFDTLKYSHDIVCISPTFVSRLKLKDIENQVYQEYIDKREREEQLFDNISIYNQEYLNEDKIPKIDKLFVVLKLISNRRLVGNDSIEYIKNVFNNIFGNDEDISLNILSIMVNNHTRPVSVISYKDKDEYKFIICNPNEEETLKLFNKDELLDLITSGYLIYDETNPIKGLEDDKDDRAIKIESSRTTSDQQRKI